MAPPTTHPALPSSSSSLSQFNQSLIGISAFFSSLVSLAHLNTTQSNCIFTHPTTKRSAAAPAPAMPACPASSYSSFSFAPSHSITSPRSFVRCYYFFIRSTGFHSPTHNLNLISKPPCRPATATTSPLRSATHASHPISLPTLPLRYLRRASHTPRAALPPPSALPPRTNEFSKNVTPHRTASHSTVQVYTPPPHTPAIPSIHSYLLTYIHTIHTIHYIRTHHICI